MDEFLAALPHEGRRADARAVTALLSEVTGEEPVVWGRNIVGFGETTGATPWPRIAFAPRKNELVLYLSTALDDADFEGLGPHRRGKACLYVKRVDDLDQARLRALVLRSLDLAGG